MDPEQFIKWWNWLDCTNKLGNVKESHLKILWDALINFKNSETRLLFFVRSDTWGNNQVVEIKLFWSIFDIKVWRHTLRWMVAKISIVVMTSYLHNNFIVILKYGVEVIVNKIFFPHYLCFVADTSVNMGGNQELAIRFSRSKLLLKPVKHSVTLIRVFR